ncbi:MAG: sulfurtransferase [Actinomycetes bacterium]
MSLPPFLAPEQLPALLSGDDPPALVDVRWSLDGQEGRHTYLEGHLPGAVFADLDVDLAGPPTPAGGRHPLPDPAAFAAVLGRLGIGDHTPVVAYDQGGGAIAARLVWMLRILGREAAVLSGGLAAWEGPLERGDVQRASAWSTPRPWPSDAVADADRVAATAASGGIVLDARDPERYRGDEEPVDARAGHVPGAVNLPHRRNLGPDGRVLSSPGLRARYAEVGVGEDERVDDAVVYCGSGVTACHDALALEAAGLGRPRVFVGSWSAWSADPERPVATGPDPGGD